MDGELLGAESHSFTSDFQWNTIGFEKDAAGADACSIVFGGTFTFTHTNTQTLSGHGTIGENADPELTLTFHLTSDSLTGSLNLTSSDPISIQRFQRE